MPRSFKVCFEVEKPYQSLYNDVKKAFIGMGYKVVEEKENYLVFEKGSKIATYIGLTGWNLVYRKVQVEINRVKKRKLLVFLTYNFSWLTNIAILIKAAYGELMDISQALGAKSVRVIKFR